MVATRGPRAAQNARGQSYAADVRETAASAAEPRDESETQRLQEQLEDLRRQVAEDRAQRHADVVGLRSGLDAAATAAAEAAAAAGVAAAAAGGSGRMAGEIETLVNQGIARNFGELRGSVDEMMAELAMRLSAVEASLGTNISACSPGTSPEKEERKEPRLSWCLPRGGSENEEHLPKLVVRDLRFKEEEDDGSATLESGPPGAAGAAAAPAQRTWVEQVAAKVEPLISERFGELCAEWRSMLEEERVRSGERAEVVGRSLSREIGGSMLTQVQTLLKKELEGLCARLGVSATAEKPLRISERLAALENACSLSAQLQADSPVANSRASQLHSESVSTSTGGLGSFSDEEMHRLGQAHKVLENKVNLLSRGATQVSDAHEAVLGLLRSDVDELRVKLKSVDLQDAQRHTWTLQNQDVAAQAAAVGEELRRVEAKVCERLAHAEHRIASLGIDMESHSNSLDLLLEAAEYRCGEHRAAAAPRTEEEEERVKALREENTHLREEYLRSTVLASTPARLASGSKRLLRLLAALGEGEGRGKDPPVLDAAALDGGGADRAVGGTNVDGAGGSGGSPVRILHEFEGPALVLTQEKEESSPCWDSEDSGSPQLRADVGAAAPHESVSQPIMKVDAPLAPEVSRPLHKVLSATKPPQESRETVCAPGSCPSTPILGTSYRAPASIRAVSPGSFIHVVPPSTDVSPGRRTPIQPAQAGASSAPYPSQNQALAATVAAAAAARLRVAEAQGAMTAPVPPPPPATLAPAACRQLGAVAAAGTAPGVATPISIATPTLTPTAPASPLATGAVRAVTPVSPSRRSGGVAAGGGGGGGPSAVAAAVAAAVAVASAATSCGVGASASARGSSHGTPGTRARSPATVPAVPISRTSPLRAAQRAPAGAVASTASSASTSGAAAAWAARPHRRASPLIGSRDVATATAVAGVARAIAAANVASVGGGGSTTAAGALAANGGSAAPVPGVAPSPQASRSAGAGAATAAVASQPSSQRSPATKCRLLATGSRA